MEDGGRQTYRHTVHNLKYIWVFPIMEYYPVMKKEWAQLHAETGVNLRNIILDKQKHQVQVDIYTMIEKKKTSKQEKLRNVLFRHI